MPWWKESDFRNLNSAADVNEAKKRAKRREVLVYFNPDKRITVNEWPELITIKIFDYLTDEKTAESWLHLFPQLKRWYTKKVERAMLRFNQEKRLQSRYYESWKCSQCHSSFLLRPALDFHVYMKHVYPTLKEDAWYYINNKKQ